MALQEGMAKMDGLCVASRANGVDSTADEATAEALFAYDCVFIERGGASAWGAIVKTRDGRTLWCGSGTLAHEEADGKMAEYTAMIAGLSQAIALGVRSLCVVTEGDYVKNECHSPRADSLKVAATSLLRGFQWTSVTAAAHALKREAKMLAQSARDAAAMFVELPVNALPFVAADVGDKACNGAPLSPVHAALSPADVSDCSTEASSPLATCLPLLSRSFEFPSPAKPKESHEQDNGGKTLKASAERVRPSPIARPSLRKFPPYSSDSVVIVPLSAKVAVNGVLSTEAAIMDDLAHSYVSSNLTRACNLAVRPLDDGDSRRTDDVLGSVTLKLSVGRMKIHAEALVRAQAVVHLVLGADFLRKNGVSIASLDTLPTRPGFEYADRHMRLDPRALRVELKADA